MRQFARPALAILLIDQVNRGAESQERRDFARPQQDRDDTSLPGGGVERLGEGAFIGVSVALHPGRRQHNDRRAAAGDGLRQIVDGHTARRQILPCDHA